MKIVGGTYGVDGQAWISRDRKLVVEGVARRNYNGSDITRVLAGQSKSRSFGFLGFIVGSVLFSFLLGAFLGVIGVAIAIGICLLGSFYSTTENTATIDFIDDNSVVLKCTARDIKKLYKLKAGL